MMRSYKLDLSHIDYLLFIPFLICFVPKFSYLLTVDF